MATTHMKLRPVDPTIWRACAGNSVHIPAVGSRAYYFPQGHAQHSSSTTSFSPLVQSRPFFLCRLMGVDYLADTETDEVLAKLQLIPIPPQLDDSAMTIFSDFVPESTEFTSVVKVLTPSDANNGGGFSVPKSCADLVFPQLDFMADPPVQTLRVKDVLGVVWEFRHIYRGTPRRHLLTTGWSKFVNSKKLVAGDSVVFMKSRRSGDNFVGIRRAVKAVNVGSGGMWNYFEEEEQGEKEKECGKTPVEEAVELAMNGVGFEIVYYPKLDASDFVVKAEKVEKSILGGSWTVGTRVKLAVETEDLSRMTWVQGTVSNVNEGASQNSPWKMLQITWDEPDVVQNMTNVSPWQVEYVAVPEHSEFSPAKKCRISEDAGHLLYKDGEQLIPGKCKISEHVGLLPHGDGELFPVAGSSNLAVGHLNDYSDPFLMKCSSYPEGMQGARQDQICVSGVSNFIHENAHETGSNYFVNMSPVVETVSTELNIGNTQLSNLWADPPKTVQFFSNEVQLSNLSADPPKTVQFFGNEVQLSNLSADPPKTVQFFGNEVQLSNLSADTPKTVQFFGNEVVGTRVCTASPKVGISSIQLFGKIIHM